MTFHAIETEYDGIMYRSRTEAKWAVFFSDSGIPFEYETEGFQMGKMRYLPDFYLPIGKCWFEVKPDYPTDREIRKAMRLAKGTRKLVFIATGAPRADIGLLVVSPSGAMKRDWQICYAHEDGIGYIVDDLCSASFVVKIRETDAAPGMYSIGPSSELDSAGSHHFQWRNGQSGRHAGHRRVIENPNARRLSYSWR